ncbi:MAG: Ada metal-binding domain-containing protein [Pseudonocardiaceae bacterium]
MTIIPAHRRGFASVAAAQLTGYRPCQHCRPATAVTARETS